MRNLDYQQRLLRLDLTTLRTRKLKGDLIQMFKLVNSYEQIEFNKGINFGLNTKLGSQKYELRRNSYCLTSVRDLTFFTKSCKWME